tara:strand:- start:7485 stop:7598 length:114 start_codon:yes stop_codon:yes gene_type:complete
MNKKQILIMAIAIILFPITIPLAVITLSLRKAGTYNG